MTWLRSAGGWELFANRDEQRARLPALPPAVQERDGVRLLAPVDADAQGTWIGVNEHGVGLCLLNGRSRRDEEGANGFRSRGLLVQDLLVARDLDEVATRLARENLDRYRGLFLLALGIDQAPVLHAWDGRALSRDDDPAQPLVSSSRDTEEARRHREHVWRALHADGGTPSGTSLTRFLRSHEPEPGPWSVCMHREDARTVSASHVVAREHGPTEFHSAPGPPCRTGWNAAVVLEGRPTPRA